MTKRALILLLSITAAVFLVVTAWSSDPVVFGTQNEQKALSKPWEVHIFSPIEPLILDSNVDKNLVSGLHEPLLLDSYEDLSEGSDLAAIFCWTGSMIVTLTGVTVYNSMEDAGISSDDHFYRDVSQAFGNRKMKFIVCDIVLENIDAEPDTSPLMPECFHIGIFRLVVEGISPDFAPPDSRLPIYYFDGTITGATPRQLLYFYLEKGEVKQFRLGYFLDEGDLYKPCALSIGINAMPPANLKYQLRFAITPEMAKSA